MSVGFVYCDECKEKLSSAYAVTIPVAYVKCDKCNTALTPRTRTYYFCSWDCLVKWVNKYERKEK